MEFRWLGISDFDNVLELQLKIRKEVEVNPSKAVVLGLEHSSVITLGQRAIFEDELNVSPAQLQNEGWQLRKTDRGGRATLHNPGQLVIYPIVNIKSIGVRNYVCMLAQATNQVLKDLGVSAEYNEDQPGLYTPNGKIAFFGIRVTNGISYHGLSLNVCNRLDDFGFIQSCGVSHPRLDKVSIYAPSATCQQVFKSWELKFSKIFDPEDAKLTSCSFEYRSKL